MNKIVVKKFRRFRSYGPQEHNKFDIPFYRFLPCIPVELVCLNFKLECQSVWEFIETFDTNENSRILGDCKAGNYLKTGLFSEG